MTYTELYTEQLQTWQLASDNYQQLDNILRRTINMGTYRINVQCNPARVNSTLAGFKTLTSRAVIDANTVASRNCFLCRENRPKEQLAVQYGSYEILLNPYPIFAPHYTIVSLQHEPQRITGRVGTLVTLARMMQGMTVFFNGSASGASAPDHLHFQAVPSEQLPLYADFGQNPHWGFYVHRGHNYTVTSARNIGRLVYRIVCTDTAVAQHAVERLLTELGIPCSMTNILARAIDDKNVEIYVIPRRNLRPKQFYLKDEKRLVISPASIEMAGVFITPDQSTFDRIQRADIEDILYQTTYSDSDLKTY